MYLLCSTTFTIFDIMANVDHSMHCVDLDNIDEDIAKISAIVGERCFKSALLTALRSNKSDVSQVFSIDIGLKTPGQPGAFSVQVRELGTLAHFQETHKESKRVACHGCKKFLAVESAMRCSGCKKAFYCSRQCQKNAWKTHKSLCSKAFL